MRSTLARTAFALVAFAAILQWSRPAAADVNITGTVGEIGAGFYYYAGQGSYKFRFKMTNVALTNACNPVNNNNTLVGYTWFHGDANQPLYREWFAMLLVSKKGSPMTCTMTDAPDCKIVNCILP